MAMLIPDRLVNSTGPYFIFSLEEPGLCLGSDSSGVHFPFPFNSEFTVSGFVHLLDCNLFSSIDADKKLHFLSFKTKAEAYKYLSMHPDLRGKYTVATCCFQHSLLSTSKAAFFEDYLKNLGSSDSSNLFFKLVLASVVYVNEATRQVLAFSKPYDVDANRYRFDTLKQIGIEHFGDPTVFRFPFQIDWNINTFLSKNLIFINKTLKKVSADTRNVIQATTPYLRVTCCSLLLDI